MSGIWKIGMSLLRIYGGQMKPPNNSRYVLTWQKDSQGLKSWIIDLHVNGVWVEASTWECEVLSWQELPQPPNLLCDKDCKLCNVYQEKKDCYDATLRGKKEDK